MIINPHTSHVDHFSKSDKGAPQGGVVHVSTQNLEKEVLKRSDACPVVLSFGSPRSSLSGQLVLNLESLQQTYPRPWVLAQVNVDEQRSLAVQFRVQSVPAVLVLAHGRPVDAFMGTADIKTLSHKLDQAYRLYPEQACDQACVLAEKAFCCGDYGRCATILQQYLDQQEGQLTQEDVQRLLLSYLFMGQKERASAVLDLLKEHAEARYWLDYWPSGRDPDTVVGEWLVHFSRTRAHKDDLLRLFSLLGADHVLVKEGRKKMSRIVFA